MMPNWMMPKSTTSRIGRTKENSVIVCPRSFSIVFFSCISAPTSKISRGPRRQERAPLMLGRLCEKPHQAGHCIRTVLRESSEREERAPADHRERDRLVGLRLSMLTREKREELLDSMPAVVLHDQTPVLGNVCELQLGANCIECGGDRRGEQAERHDNCDRDHCQDDAVLGHRLTLLDGKACAKVMDQILERH